MKRCDVCKSWIPRTDMGYCKHSGTEDVDCSDCCDLFEKDTEDKKGGLKDVIKSTIVPKL